MKSKSLTVNGSASVPTSTSITSRKHKTHDEVPGPVVAETTPAQGGEIPSDQIVPAEDETVEFWVSKISLAVRNSAAWMIQAGQELIQAKAKLGHGRWMMLFQANGLKFSLRTGETLMRIAGHSYLNNSQHIANLPPSVVALNELSQLDSDAISRGVAEGAINPDMTVREAKKFVQANQQQPATPAEPTVFDAEKHLSKLRHYVLAVLDQWPVSQRGDLAVLLETLAGEVRSNPKGDEAPTEGKI